jgi:hypothetical protein
MERGWTAKRHRRERWEDRDTGERQRARDRGRYIEKETKGKWERYSYKTSFHKTSRHKTSSHKTSRLQNVLASKRPAYKTSMSTKRPCLQNVLPSYCVKTFTFINTDIYVLNSYMCTYIFIYALNIYLLQGAVHCIKWYIKCTH